MHITAPSVPTSPNLPSPITQKSPGGNQSGLATDGNCSMGGNQPTPATSTVGTRVNVKV